MEQGHLLYVIGVGDFEDWQVGGGSIYYIEDRKGEKALPVFSTPEGANQYRRANFGTPSPPLDILKSVRREHVTPLSEGRFIVMPLDAEGLARRQRQLEPITQSLTLVPETSRKSYA